MNSQAVEYTDNELEFEIKFIAAVDVKVAASILYNAYFDDPLFTKIFKKGDEGYEMRLRSAIREELNTFWDAQQPVLGVYRAGTLVAVTCLIEPDADLFFGRYWHWRLRMLTTAGFMGTQHLLEKEKQVRTHLSGKCCHMISFIGVHPMQQDQGIGHILLAAINDVVANHRTSTGAAVFVTLDKCLSFFDDGGFDHIATISTKNINGQLMYRAISS